MPKGSLPNEIESDDPMHHLFHVHGAGRFVVLARDSVPEANLVWKDTVLFAPARPSTSCSTSRTRVGGWAHSHIAEHHESGMMLSFDVTLATAA